MSMPHKP